MLPLKHPRRNRRGRRSLRTLDPARFLPQPVNPPQPASAVMVSASFSNRVTVWHFDRAVTITAAPGGWSMFQLIEDGGTGSCTGASAVQLDAQRIAITMDVAPEDNGNGWFWNLASVPPKVKTSEGADVFAAEGDVTFGDTPG